MLRLTWVIAGVLLAFAGNASAATVRLDRIEERDEGETFVYGGVSFEAAAGEANALTVEYVAAPPGGTPAVVVTDTGAPLTAQDRCQQVDASTARCQTADVPRIESVGANLGDMNDEATYVGPQDVYATLLGGDGDDDLTINWGSVEGGEGRDTLASLEGDGNLDGGNGDDDLTGNGGSDYLDGGTGDDMMRGGDGNDFLYAGGSAGQPGAAGRDTLEGGPGIDVLSDEDGNGTTPEINRDILDGGEGFDDVSSYILREGAVVVDLAGGNDQGERGENDRLENLESVTGGFGADILAGNDADNYINGEGGRDLVTGGGGKDRLISTANAGFRQNALAPVYGPDTISGDAGDDLVETYATMESAIACGDGEDRISMEGYASENDHPKSSLGPLVSQTCERLEMRGSKPRRSVAIDPSPVKVKRKRLVFSFFKVKCCMHFFEIEHVTGKRTELAHKRIRRKRIRLNVGRRVIGRSRDENVTLRGKVTRVNINRFVWRFQIGPQPF